MLKKKLRDKLVGLGFALSLGLSCVGFAVLGSSPIEASADFTDDNSYPYGLHVAGSLWRFKNSPDILSFPILNNIGLTGSIYESGRTTTFETIFNLKFTGDSLVFDDGGANVYTVTRSTAYKFSFYLNSDYFLNTVSNISYSDSDRANLISWLSVNCDLLEPPTDDIPENGLTMSENSTMLFFRVSDILSANPNDSIGFFNMRRDENIYVDLNTYISVLPYSVTFHDTANGFRVDSITLIACSSYWDYKLPFLHYFNGTNFYHNGFTFDPAGSTSSYWRFDGISRTDLWGSTGTWTRTGSYKTFGYAPSALISFFTNEFGDSYQYLEKCRTFVNSFLGYSQFVYGDAPYSKGYTAGYTDGRNNGFDDGKAIGYQEGYNAGLNSVSTGSTAIVSLFGGIASVPINILNGLSEFTIWNVPIINILVTFLFIGLIAFVIRKLIV